MRPIEIEGFQHYSVNEEGVVVNTKNNRVLKTDLNSAGYKRVTLSSDTKLIRIFVHKLVALTYVDGYEEGLVVNHKDGNKINNHKSNLEWVSASFNRKHAFANKLCRRPHSKLSDDIVHSICKAIVDKENSRDIQREFNIPKHVYQDIHSRRYYKDISCNYLW